jgi:hypothetical protein
VARVTVSSIRGASHSTTWISPGGRSLFFAKSVTPSVAVGSAQSRSHTSASLLRRVDPRDNYRDAVRDRLDFLVIGAQKSGTTSLFRHLASHPDVAVPPEKEAPFFSGERADPRAWGAYLADYFSGADPNQKWGTVTPQYMSRPGVAAQIAATLPSCRIVAVLRHPIERALSHHQMIVKRDGDSRSPDTAMTDLLEPAALAAARDDADIAEREECGYIVRGEYGRILTEYGRWFPSEQIAVVLLDELEAAPLDTWQRIARHLDLDPAHVPPDLDRRHHVGGTERRTVGVYSLRRSRLALAAWHLVPSTSRRRFRFWFDQWNVRPADRAPELAADLRRRLADHYRSDIARLEDLLARTVPWDDVR